MTQFLNYKYMKLFIKLPKNVSGGFTLTYKFFATISKGLAPFQYDELGELYLRKQEHGECVLSGLSSKQSCFPLLLPTKIMTSGSTNRIQQEHQCSLCSLHRGPQAKTLGLFPKVSEKLEAPSNCQEITLVADHVA